MGNINSATNRKFSKRLLPGRPEDAERLNGESIEWINANPGARYASPENICELQQGVRGIMLSGRWVPANPGGSCSAPSSATDYLETIEQSELRRDEQIAKTSLVYAELVSYHATAERLGVD